MLFSHLSLLIDVVVMNDNDNEAANKLSLKENTLQDNLTQDLENERIVPYFWSYINSEFI